MFESEAPPLLSPEPGEEFKGAEVSKKGSALDSPLPMRWVHWPLILIFVAFTDYLLYQVPGGYAAWGVWTVLAAVLLFIGIESSPRWTLVRFGMAIALGLTACRFVWEGHWVLTFLVIGQLAWWTMELHRFPLEWSKWTCFFLFWIPDGIVTAPPVVAWSFRSSSSRGWKRGLEYLVPLGVAGVFALIFLNANPESLSHFQETLSKVWDNVAIYLQRFAFKEVLLWGILVILALGALFPVLMRDLETEKKVPGTDSELPPSGTQELLGTLPSNDRLIQAISFNTLLVLVLMFTIYLAAEVHAMWFRTFPEGFHYSGYAHQGAAWLTVALALATIVLSVIFQRPIKVAERPRGLLLLAQIWAIQNWVLALCVYNRLWIYVQFNGLTTLRIVGFLGITSVAIGLLLVMIMIYKNWSIAKLLNAQVWTVAIAIFAYFVVPFDAIVHRYNCKRILAGDDSPSVQLHVQEISSTGWLELIPLVDAKNPIVRDGTRSMLASLLLEEEAKIERGSASWHSYQVADRRLVDKLQRIRESHLAPYLNSEPTRGEDLFKFREYAMQWY